MCEKTEGPSAGSRKLQSLVRFFAKSPLAKAKINLKRKRDLGRKVKL